MDETALNPIEATPDDTITLLLERMRGISGRRKLRAWLISSAICAAFAAMMIGLGTAGYLESGWAALGALALSVGPGVWIWILAEQREARTMEALAASRELRALGGLLDALNWSSRRVRKTVQNALLYLLPLLTEEHSGMLNTGHREVLNALLYGNSGELAMEALSAIEKVGDGTSLPYLTSIAAGKGVPVTLRNRQLEVQTHAQRTVEAIRERIDKQNRASMLLRASQIPNTPSEQLVRPAQGQSGVNAEELLRPELSAELDSSEKEEML